MSRNRDGVRHGVRFVDGRDVAAWTVQTPDGREIEHGFIRGVVAIDTGGFDQAVTGGCACTRAEAG